MSEWQRVQCSTGGCAEVLVGLTDVALRNSDRPDVAVAFSLDEWQALCDAIKRGDFEVEA